MFWLNRVHSLTLLTYGFGRHSRQNEAADASSPSASPQGLIARPTAHLHHVDRTLARPPPRCGSLVGRAPASRCPVLGVALVPHRRKEGRSHCEALIPASQTVGGCQLAEVQERLHQGRLNITDYFFTTAMTRPAGPNTSPGTPSRRSGTKPGICAGRSPVRPSRPTQKRTSTTTHLPTTSVIAPPGRNASNGGGNSAHKATRCATWRRVCATNTASKVTRSLRTNRRSKKRSKSSMQRWGISTNALGPWPDNITHTSRRLPLRSDELVVLDRANAR